MKIVEDLIKRIADEIIEQGKEQLYDDNSQTLVEYADIEQQFAQEIAETINDLIEVELNKRKEIADLTLDTDGFDIVFYTDFI